MAKRQLAILRLDDRRRELVVRNALAALAIPPPAASPPGSRGTDSGSLPVGRIACATLMLGAINILGLHDFLPVIALSSLAAHLGTGLGASVRAPAG